MKLDKRQTILEGEVKVLKDTVWRLTTRVYGLEEQIKEMKTKLKITTTVDTRHVDLQQIPQTIALVGRTRNVRTNSKSLVSSTPSSSSPKHSQKPKTKEKQSKNSYSKTPDSRSKGKARYVAVKKTAGGSSTKTSKRRLEHQSVITKRGRRATSFKLQPSDEEKEVYYISDSSDDAEKQKKQNTVKQKRQPTPVKSSPKPAQEDLVTLAKNELSSFNILNNSNTFDAHEDLIMFTENADVNTDYASSVTIHLVGNDDSDQLPLKKRRLDASADYDSSSIILNLPNFAPSTEDDVRNEDELCDPVTEGFTSYVHKPPDTFNCFFCGQEFPTDEERVIHTKIHAGNKKI